MMKMAAISKEDVKYLTGDLKQLIDAQDKYRIEKENYTGYDWYNDGSGRELQEEIDFLAASVSCFLDVMIENKVKEMMNEL